MRPFILHCDWRRLHIALLSTAFTLAGSACSTEDDSETEDDRYAVERDAQSTTDDGGEPGASESAGGASGRVGAAGSGGRSGPDRGGPRGGGGSVGRGGSMGRGGSVGRGGSTGSAGVSMGDGGSSAIPCGPATCSGNMFCCNESCGICAPPGGVCTQQACEDRRDASVPKGGACSEDSDCVLFDDYCTGCDCRALLESDPLPVCPGPGVRCFAQPCANHTAACEQGACVVR